MKKKTDRKKGFADTQAAREYADCQTVRVVVYTDKRFVVGR